MIAGRKVLALIPARGGSKRLPRKNVLSFAGKPLIAWTVEAARLSAHVDRVILSSDDPEIIAVAKAAGCDVPFVRPAELATDSASSMDVIWHALDSLGETFDDIVLLQPTSPLRTADDIDACLALRHETSALAVVSVTPLPKPGSYFGFTGENAVFNRQGVFAADPESVCSLNGAVYVADVARLRAAGTFYDGTTRAYSMPNERSLDIDTAADFAIAEIFARQAQGGGS